MPDLLIENWEKTLSLLERGLSSASYNSWILPLEPYRIDGGEALLIAPEDYFISTINMRHLSTIKRLFNSVIHERTGDSSADYNVRIILRNDIRNDGGIARATETVRERSVYRESFNQKYVFETFVKGKCNEFAFAASQAVAESPGKTANYNPLFLYGGVGLGKTHLMQSIGNYILDYDKTARVLYTTSENLTNEFIASIRERRNQEFRDRYRNIDVLMVDDIQFLSDKEETQEEFFHTFNTLHFANKQIVISSDKPPGELKTIEERLRGRFGMGLTVDITPPDYETRTAILENKADIENLSVPKDVLRFIAKNISSNIRDLEGALTRVSAYSKLTNTEITVEMAEKALQPMLSENEKREITVGFIQEIVASFYRVTVEEINSRKKSAHLSYARHMAMYLSRMLIDIPLSKVGEKFGKRDHTTIMHACNKISAEMESKPDVAATVRDLENRIKNQ